MNKFKLPIEYNNPKLLDENIINNLELKNIKFINNFNDYFSNNDIFINDNSYNLMENDKNNLYECILKPDNLFSKLSTSLYSNVYTNNKSYLSDTQDFIKNINNTKFNIFNYDYSLRIIEVFSNIQNEVNFIEKYQYLEFPVLKELNNNSSFLQILSIYNLFSPILNLISPIIIILIPFLFLIRTNQPLTIENYLINLKDSLGNNPIGKLLMRYSNSSMSEKCSLIFWSLLYIYQIYNSIFYCIKFFSNIKIIHEKINVIKDYLIKSVYNFNNLSSIIENYDTYKEFNIEMKENINKINTIISYTDKISDYKLNPNKLLELGDLMKIFYIFHQDHDINNVLHYTFYLNGYIDNMNRLSNLNKLKKINNCKFNNKNVIIDNYYPIYIDNSLGTITNNIELSNNVIITGPNASGKTTSIKSFLFNYILSQQFGMGCYKSANLQVFDKFFCYLNIPDTNDRDSLFQAEARVCKNIIEYLNTNKFEKCLCIFDELYSGTNPDEAITASYSFLKYLNKKNCKFILTTHFYKLCKIMEKDNNIKNYSMKVKKKNDDIIFTYKLDEGISYIKGAYNILKKLNYPDNLLKEINYISQNINKY